MKLITNYSGLSFNESIQLDCYTYKQLLVDAYVDNLNSTEEGRDYLEQCWMLKQTSPDRKSLRKHFKET